jgi:hypothetical protein
MKDKYRINLLPYKDVIKYCKKYFKKKEKPKRGKPKVYEDYFIPNPNKIKTDVQT